MEVTGPPLGISRSIQRKVLLLYGTFSNDDKWTLMHHESFIPEILMLQE